MSKIERFLPNNQYQAAMNANAPSTANPFLTEADVPTIIERDYGSFYDTTTQTVAMGIVKAMELNTTDLAATNGFTITNNTLGRPTRITASKDGVYNLQFSAQLNRLTGGNTKQADIWIAINDTPVPASATGVNVQANAKKLVAAWNWFITLNAGQYVEIMWTQDDAIDILYEAAAGVIPVDTPSVIVTINQV